MSRMVRSILKINITHKNDETIFRLILAIAALTAGIISLSIGLRQSVWFDEAYSVLVAQQSLGELLRLTALDTHPPLYYLLLKGWASVFGWDELSLRLSSVLCMILALIIGGLLLRKMFGAKIAIGGVLTMMLAPLLLRYGFEIRMYASASLVGVAATYALYSAWKARPQKHKVAWLAVYGLLVAAGTYLLYYLVFVWIAHVVWLLHMHVKCKRSWKLLVPFVSAYMGASMLFVPWLPTFFSQISNGALAPIGRPLNLDQLIGVGTFNLVYQPLHMVSVGLTILIVAVIISIVWLVSRAKIQLRDRHAELMLITLYFIIPIVLLMIISLFRSMYTERYLSHIAISMIMLMGVVTAAAFVQIWSDKLRAAVVGCVIFGTLAIGTVQLAVLGNFNFQRLQTPTLNQVAASLSDCAPGYKLLTADPYVKIELGYYLPDCSLYFVSPWSALGGGYAPLSGSPYQVMDTNKLDDKRLIYIYYDTPDQQLPKRYTEMSRGRYGAINIVRYEL